MDDLLHVSDINGGYLFRHQLNELGCSDKMIKRLIRSGRLQRLRYGTYAPRATYAGLSAVDKHRVLAYSLLDKLGPTVAASHQTASVLHGHDLYDVDLSSVHLTRLDGRTGRTEAGVTYHEGKLRSDTAVVEVDGRLVTSPMRSVIETASLATTESGLVLVSSALRSEVMTKPDLVSYADEFAHWRGTRRARLALRLADARLESVGEARSLHMFWRHGLPLPELQYVVLDATGRHVARTDFCWCGHRHVGEFDGLVKYGRLNPYANDPGRVIVDEKVREDLVRDQDLGMSRWIWQQMYEAAQKTTVAGIRAKMEQSKRLYLRNATHISMS